MVKVADVRDAIAMAVAPTDHRIFVASRRGQIYALSGAAHIAKVLDLSSQAPCCPGEGGFLDFAFSPSGSRVFASFVDAANTLVVMEFEVRDGRILPEAQRKVLAVPQLSERHHGGHLAFDRDGYLWIGTGDASLGFDPTDEAQSLQSLLGKLLRIDPRPSEGRPYQIPSGNPFVGLRGAKPEIALYGLRNPWRFSFDRTTGDLWIADVGQWLREEIDFLPAGSAVGTNLGWNRMEGSRHLQGIPPKKAIPPIVEYVHDGERCAVIGGYVYRGTAIEDLQGAYIYADFCDGTVRALEVRRGNLVSKRSLGVHLDGLASFGEDADGELYALSLSKGLFRLESATGKG